MHLTVLPRSLDWSSGRLAADSSKPACVARAACVRQPLLQLLTKPLISILRPFHFENPRLYYFCLGVLGVWEGARVVDELLR